MCAVSNVGDRYSDKTGWPSWPDSLPFPGRSPSIPVTIPEKSTSFRLTQLENQLLELRSQVQTMHEGLRKAKQQDIDEGNPDCEMEDKVIILKKIAEMVGVNLEDVFPND